MKRLFAVLLALLLLCGCGKAAEKTGSEAVTTTVAPETEAPDLTEVSELTADSILLYRQSDFKARQGTLLPLETALSAPEEELLPRTHYYDEYFPEEYGTWLELLDYTLGQGYLGFSVPKGTLPELSTKQRRLLAYIYRIDGGKVLALNEGEVTTSWYECRADRTDTMEKFAIGLAAARELAAQAPRGDDWETAMWIMNALADRITYGDRDTYFMYRGNMLYDAMTDGDTVCAGYSAGMYYLCSLCGVECLEVTGLANSQENAGGLDDHVWDYVEIYGNWYCFDPTGFDFQGDGKMDGRTPIYCGLSEEVLNILGGHRRTGEYTDDTILPTCDTCFDPAAAWNDSPEGALKTWLLYASFTAAQPSYLLIYADLMTPDTEFTVSDDQTQAVVDIPYSDYAAWAERFMRADVLGPIQFTESEDGKLLLRRVSGSEINWAGLEVGSTVQGEDGLYTADLGAVTASFTVSETDATYVIETIELTPNE